MGALTAGPVEEQPGTHNECDLAGSVRLEVAVPALVGGPNRMDAVVVAGI